MGWIYFIAAVALGSMLIAGAFGLRLRPERAMRFFMATNIYLAGVFFAIALDALVL
jgi:heme O synthase-like polyprenyltransferase